VGYSSKTLFPSVRQIFNDNLGVMHSGEFIFLNVAVLAAIPCLFLAYQYFLLRKRIRLGKYQDLSIE
jgi:hypothetical protein